MAEIQLTKGYVAIVDDEDFERANAFPWRVLLAPTATTPYAHGQPGGSPEYLHRFILGAPVGVLVDHRDYDGLNCRRGNLRIATHAQNCANSRRPPGEAGYRGVVAVRTKGIIYGWTARLSVKNRGHYLGFFATPEEAARKYDEAARRIRGEFAICNFPEEAGTC